MKPRGQLVTAACTSGVLIAAAPSPHAAAVAVATGDLGTCLAAACGALAALVAGVLALGSLLVLGAALPGRVGAAAELAAQRCLPRVLRTALVAAIGIAGVALPATAAGADTGGPVSPRLVSPRLVPDLDRPASGHPALVALPSAAAQPAAAPAASHPAPLRHREVAPAPTSHPQGTGAVLVAPGDTLWQIAATSLGARASDAAIAATWPQWWSSNRAVIGDDPDLIHPGQQLTPPTER